MPTVKSRTSLVVRGLNNNKVPIMSNLSIGVARKIYSNRKFMITASTQ